MNFVYRNLLPSDILNKLGHFLLLENFLMIPEQNPSASILFCQMFSEILVFKKQKQAAQLHVTQIGEIT